MLSALYAIELPSVRPSVRHTGESCKKTVEVRIMKFAPYGSPIPLSIDTKIHDLG